MAETVDELLFRLHLNADEMNQQFVQVSRTLNQNLTRINRERNLINIQTQIDLQGLDAANDATQIFEIRQRSLQRQLEAQRARLNLLNVALRDTANRTGETSDATQRAQIQYEQARLAVRRLETQLESLNETQRETATNSTSWTERIQNTIETGRFISAVENIKSVIEGVTAEVTRLISRFQEMEKTAYDFNLPFDKAKDFAMQIKLAGAEIQDVGGYLRGITDALVKGEVDDPEWIALSKYGAEIFDETGRLKDYAEILEEVHKAYQKAKAEGSGIEFLQLTGGESGVTDAIQLLERYEDAKKDAAKVFKSGIDPKELQQAEISLNLLIIQLEEFHDSVSDLITPAVIETTENLFEIFRTGTQFIKENKDELRELGAAIRDLSSYLPASQSANLLFGSLKKLFKNDNDSATELMSTVDKLKSGLDGLKDKNKNNLSQYGITRTNQFKAEIEDIRLELDYIDEYERAIAELNLWKQRELYNKTSVSTDERLAIEELYNVKLAKIQRDREETQNQILEESQKRTKALMQESFDVLAERDLSAWEKESIEIKRWEEQALESLENYRDAIGDKNEYVTEAAAITVNALAKETAAFEREMDKIRGKTQSLAEKIFEQEHSRRDIDIMRAQKERAEMYEEGMYPAQMIERWFQNRLGEIRGNVAEDSSGKYTQKPKLQLDNPSGFEIIYGDNIAQQNLPTTDFYSQIQGQVDKYLNAEGSPAYNLQQQHAALQEALNVPIDKFAQSVQEFAAVPQQISSVVQRTDNRPPTVNLNVSVSPNIDLGGAYVFDNYMKMQLTDDITENVVKLVTDAVQGATSQMNYSYSN